MTWTRAILHADMDAFFVNVHLLDHPDDAGIPLAVGGRPEERGVITSASYEAREHGVRSAMATYQALRLSPGLKLVPANWPRIRECSRKVMALLGEYGPLEKMSVDEAYIDLSASADPETVAREIRERVPGELGLPASVGLATTKLVAKVASDFNKPRGFTVVAPGEEAAFLAPLPVRSIWGIGPRTAERLAELGITTCGQLATFDPGRLRATFGRESENMARRSRGEDDREVVPDHGPPKSISQEWTFSRDVADVDVLKETLRRMSAEVAGELHKRNLVAHTIRVKFRRPDFTTFTRQRSLSSATDDAETIYRHALSLWEENWPEGRPMRLLGVGVSSLAEGEGRQMGLGI